MKLRYLLLAMLFLYGGKISYAQEQFYNAQPEFLKANSVWAVTTGGGVDFNYTPPKSLSTSVYVGEGYASVADPETGELLFYSDGRRVWNALHKVMPNGGDLSGNRGSGIQGVLIMPVINAPGKYYLFSKQEVYYTKATPPAVYYSIIDMSLDNGSGDIVPGKKNIPLTHATDILSEAMIAVPGDQCDIWLLLHDWQDPVFRAFHITEAGIDTIPVISHTGHQIQGPFAYDMSALAVSPDRSMVAITSYNINSIPGQTGVLVARFNSRTGEVTDAVPLSYDKSYGVCFSPGNSKLYVNFEVPNRTLIQYDMTEYDSSSIASSAISIEDTDVYGSIFRGGLTLSTLKLYQGKVYRVIPNTNRITSINEPDRTGKDCNYDTGAIRLLPSSKNSISLPNDVVFPLPPDTVYHLNLDTVVCRGEELMIRAEGNYESRIWDDGATDSVRSVKVPGVYRLTQGDGCHFYVDTFIVRYSDMERPVISINVTELSTHVVYDSYQWLLYDQIIEDATQRIYKTLENGDYRVAVVKGNCADTSEVYEVRNVSGTGIAGWDDPGRSIAIFPNPASGMIYISSPVAVHASVYSADGRLITTVENARYINMEAYRQGVYFLKVFDGKGRLLKSEKIVK